MIAPDLPTIVLGDFNALPNSLAYHTFLEHGFIDTYSAAGHDEEIDTFHRFMGADFEASGVRLDWIFVKSSSRTFSTESCDVIQDAAPPIYPSDHYPVMATLRLE